MTSSNKSLIFIDYPNLLFNFADYIKKSQTLPKWVKYVLGMNALYGYRYMTFFKDGESYSMNGNNYKSVKLKGSFVVYQDHGIKINKSDYYVLKGLYAYNLRKWLTENRYIVMASHKQLPFRKGLISYVYANSNEAFKFDYYILSHMPKTSTVTYIYYTSNIVDYVRVLNEFEAFMSKLESWRLVKSIITEVS